MQTQRKNTVRLIRRYANRKLYDVRKSRYITLDGIRALVQAGEDVHVVDNETGEELTGVTFAQVIYESAKRTNGSTPLPALRWLIQRGDEAVREFKHGVEIGRDAIESVREAAERGVQRLVGKGRGRERRGLIDDLLDAPQRGLDELQHRIEQQIREAVERFTRHPALRNELRRIERSLHELENRLGRRTEPTARKKSRRKATRGGATGR